MNNLKAPYVCKLKSKRLHSLFNKIFGRTAFFKKSSHFRAVRLAAIYTHVHKARESNSEIPILYLWKFHRNQRQNVLFFKFVSVEVGVATLFKVSWWVLTRTLHFS